MYEKRSTPNRVNLTVCPSTSIASSGRVDFVKRNPVGRVSTTCPNAPNPAAVILTSSLPPGTTDGAAKDRVALAACASTGLTTNNSNTTKAAAATTNSANTFPIMALPFPHAPVL